MKFTFIAEDSYDDGDEHRVTKEFTAETWHDALMSFEEFLRGCGYVFNGYLDLVEEDPVKLRSKVEIPF